MNFIFLGFLLVFLDFNFNFGKIIIDLLPDFLGFLLILKGLNSFRDIDNKKAIWYTEVSLFYSAILYFLELRGFFPLGLIRGLLSLISTVLILLATYHIIDAFKQLENQLSLDLRTGSLLKMLYISTFLSAFIIVNEQIRIYITHYIDIFYFIPLIFSLLADILFLIDLYQAAHSYSSAN